MITLKNVSKFYYSKGVIASGITRVNLDLDVGEFVVITGESGSGKSTLLNVISGLDTYEEGEMYVNGHETSHYTSTDFEQYRKKYIGNIFQSFNLVSSYTVKQNVELALEINGSPKDEIKKKVPEILERVGMSDYARTKVSKLSGGQKQRVAIARALAKDTKIIVADEPTGNLDSESAMGIVNLLSEVARDRLVIVVTHNFDQFKDQATRIIKMHDGRIVEDTGIKTAAERAFRQAEQREEAAGAAAPAEVPAAPAEAPAAPEAPAAEPVPAAPVAPIVQEAPAGETAAAPVVPSAAEAGTRTAGDLWKTQNLFGGAATSLYDDAELVRMAEARKHAAAAPAAAPEAAKVPAGPDNVKEADGKVSAQLGKTPAEPASTTSAAASMANAAPSATDAAVTKQTAAASGKKPEKDRPDDELDLSGRSIRYGDQVRLGIRNTFNIFPKFLLLLLVLLFVVFSVTSQYVSVKKMQDVTGDIGYNNYFANYDPTRIILEKPNRRPFTTADYEKIRQIPNIKELVKDDMVMDTQAYIENNSYSFYGYLMSVSVLEERGTEITYGRLPNEDEPRGVVLAGPDESYFTVYTEGNGNNEPEESGPESLIGKTYAIESNDGYKTRVKITGIIITNPEGNSEESLADVYSSDSTMYVSNFLLRQVRKNINAYYSTVTAEINGNLVACNTGESESRLVPNDRVERGKIMVPADYDMMYDSGYVTGKTWKITVRNNFYRQSMDFVVQETYNKDNFTAKTGYDKYNPHSGEFYVNPKDYNELFLRGNYQTTVYATSSRTIDQVVKDLEDAGYDAMSLKDHQEQFFDVDILSMLQTPFAIVMVVAVFFIAYFVIRLILKSRAGYFAILRMLGMQRRSARRIMNVEMVLVTAIAYAVYMGFIVLARMDVLHLAKLQDTILYMEPYDYVILAAIVFVMAILISGRFVRSVFKRSAMDTYREEA